MAKQPFSSAARQSCGTLALDESIVLKIEQLVEKVSTKATILIFKEFDHPLLVYLIGKDKILSNCHNSTCVTLLDLQA